MLLWVGLTLAIMSGTPLFIGMALAQTGIWVPVWLPFAVFFGLFALVVAVFALTYPVTSKRSGPDC